jgi:hypothetical protein
LASRRSVPTFHTRASRWSLAVFMPVATRTVGRRPPSFVPGQQLEPGFDDIPTLSTRQQRFTRVRLTSRHLTNLLRLFRNAHHPSRCAGAACGGLNPDPAIRVRGAHPHLLCSKAAQSWSYIVTSSSRRRGAQSSAYLTMTTSPLASRRRQRSAHRSST